MSELGAASWWRRGQILRDRPQPEETKRSNHKDTKKWCKGVKGREHNYVWVLDPRRCWNGSNDWYKHECTQCTKQDNYCWISDWEIRYDLQSRCKCGFHKEKE